MMGAIIRGIAWVVATGYTAFIILCIQLVLNQGEREQRNEKEWKWREDTSSLRWSYALRIAQIRDRSDQGYDAGVMP